MNFPSCIKIPVSKQNPLLDKASQNGLDRERITYDELITIANRVFGYGRWSHSITNQTVDFIEYVVGKYHIGCAAFVRVQLADGTFHEAMGYDNTESGTKGSAIYSARSSSITIALKKALLCFGGEIQDKINEAIGTYKHKRVNAVMEKYTGESGPAAEQNYQEESNVYRTAQLEPNIKRIKSTTVESNEKIPDLNDAELLMSDFEEVTVNTAEKINVPRNAKDPHPTATAMTEEELRLERKRKQKQKQEEFKKLMKEREMRHEDKPNPRF